MSLACTATDPPFLFLLLWFSLDLVYMLDAACYVKCGVVQQKCESEIPLWRGFYEGRSAEILEKQKLLFILKIYAFDSGMKLAWISMPSLNTCIVRLGFVSRLYHHVFCIHSNKSSFFNFGFPLFKYIFIALSFDLCG